MYFSDSDNSIIYETTYTGDERIEKCLKEIKDQENAKKKLDDLNRKEQFEEIFREKEDAVFNLPGLNFLKFTNLKIKFSFIPSCVRNYVSKKVIFYCSLTYNERYNIWNVRRDSFPVNFKLRIYRLFYNGDHFRVGDELVINTIIKIYQQLVRWADAEHRFRVKKFEKYRQGKDIFLDSDDEELFLSEDERRELHKKRDKIWKRMLPPA